MNNTLYKSRTIKRNEIVWIVDETTSEPLFKAKIIYADYNALGIDKNTNEYHLSGNETDVDFSVQITELPNNDNNNDYQVNDVLFVKNQQIYQIAPNKKFQGEDVCYEFIKEMDYPYYCPLLQENYYDVEINDEPLLIGKKQNVNGGILITAEYDSYQELYLFKHLIENDENNLCDYIIYIPNSTFEQSPNKQILITPEKYNQQLEKHYFWTNNSLLKYITTEYQHITSLPEYNLSYEQYKEIIIKIYHYVKEEIYGEDVETFISNIDVKAEIEQILND